MRERSTKGAAQQKGREMSLWEWLRGKRTPKAQVNNVFVLFDTQNILSNFEPKPDVSAFLAFSDCLERLMVKLGQLGRVVEVQTFTPPGRQIERWLDIFHSHLFFSQVCPLMVNSKGSLLTEKKDTMDPTIIKYGEMLVNTIPGTNNILCLCSGDQDFVPLLRLAQRKGWKTTIVAGKRDEARSMSEELARVAMLNPGGDGVYLI